MTTSNATRLAIDGSRLWSLTQELAEYTRADRPWTRRAFSPEFIASRQWLKRKMEQAGLRVSVDAGGNMIGRLDGVDTAAKPIVTGSHTDTVFDGGRYDGIIGVMAGIELAHTLTERGITLKHSLEVVDFLSEEPSDFGVSCVGSRAMAGMLDQSMLEQQSPDGQSLSEAIAAIGGDPSLLSTALREPGSIRAFIELHIEQGPILERLRVPLGIVTDLVGIRRFRVKLLGQADHAGTTPMDYRKDALVGAAILIQAAHQKAKALNSDSQYVVATVGYLTVSPNSSNAVPGAVALMLEVRSNNNAVLEDFGDELFTHIDPELKALQVEIEHESVSYGPPTHFDQELIQVVENAAKNSGVETVRMSSGAGHDAVYLSKIGPSAMIFTPCLNGRSHCPEESLTPEQLALGTQLLMDAILELDQSHQQQV